MLLALFGLAPPMKFVRAATRTAVNFGFAMAAVAAALIASLAACPGGKPSSLGLPLLMSP